MPMIGMDVIEVRNLAKQFNAKADEITGIKNFIESQISSTTWVGTDRDTFKSDWDSRLRPSLERVVDELQKAAQTAIKNAEMQENTSRQL